MTLLWVSEENDKVGCFNNNNYYYYFDVTVRRKSLIDIRGLLAQNVLNSLLAFPVFGLILPFIYPNAAPYHFIFRHLRLPFPITEIVTGLMYLQHMLQTSFVTAFFLLYIMMSLEFINHILRFISLGVSSFGRNRTDQTNMNKTTKIWMKSKVTSLKFENSYTIYCKIEILVKVLNCIAFYPGPVLLGMVLLLGAVFMFATLTLYSVIDNFWLYLMGPLMLICILVACIAIFPEMVNAKTYSEEWLRYWRRRVLNKESRRVLRSKQALKVNLAQFYYFDRGSVLNILQIVVYHGITLVLTLK